MTHPTPPRRDRATELLAGLQLGLCGRCGRARYASRRDARYAARIAAPGARLRAYRCADAWHLTNPAGRRQFIAPPVTLACGPALDGLDQRGRGERRYRRSGPDTPARSQSGARSSGRQSRHHPLEDARATRSAHATATRSRRQLDRRRRTVRHVGGAR